tara:strand:+ start:162 stop:881 length:720 start_codon:yes stop_codon:yes gene_type:complete
MIFFIGVIFCNYVTNLTKKNDKINRKLHITKDGSHTIFLEEMNEHYHSKKGAISESKYVFIKNGFSQLKKNYVKILEVGMGTGLNILLTLLNSNKNLKIYYHALEPYPIDESLQKKLNYCQFLNIDDEILKKIHVSVWDKKIKLNENFIFCKEKIKIENFMSKEFFDLIYFDAFAPSKQKNIWDFKIIKYCYDILNKDGIIVTYSSSGDFKRNLKKIGFEISVLEGALGKREMIRAKKI